MIASKEVLDVEEAAQLLGVSPWTVREQAKRGSLPARKVGREWRFSRQALLGWLGVAVASGRASGLREYSQEEIETFVQSDRLDLETARKAARLLTR